MSTNECYMFHRVYEKIDSSECFELMIDKNTRSCIHGRSTRTSIAMFGTPFIFSNY